MELRRVPDVPAVGGLVTQENPVRVDLPDDLQVTRRADFEDCARMRAEFLDLAY